MKARQQRILITVTVLMMVTLSGTLHAQSLVSFNQFLSNTVSASATSYVGHWGEYFFFGGPGYWSQTELFTGRPARAVETKSFHHGLAALRAFRL